MKLALALIALTRPVWVQAVASSSVCEEAQNLGNGLSEGQGYTQEYPQSGSVGTPKGFDDTIAFLVGGNYNSPIAAEIEGKAVVVGDFIIGSQGTNSIGKAGVGSGIVPSFGSVHLSVGGNIDGGKTDGETWFPAGASVEFGGACISNPKNKRANSNYPDEKACGSMFIPDVQDTGGPGNWLYTFHQKTMDTSPYEAIFEDLQVKSEFWYSLPANGVIQRDNAASWDQNWNFKAGDDSCLQVFYLDYATLNMLRSQHWGDLRFHSNLIGKTILLNVSPYDDNGNLLNEVYINGISVFHDGNGQTDKNFSPKMKASMLWNFYKTPKVVLGPKPGDSGSQNQFQGSVIVPWGGLDMHYVGQDGRLIVKGDVLHQQGGSEFHNYEFDPPCNLPLPPDYTSAFYCPTTTEEPATTTTTTTTTATATTAAATTPAATTTTTTVSFDDGDKSFAAGGGDPHFARWNKSHDSFHGECDLVMIHSENFHNGAGLDLHARTTIQDYFSFMETAALRVGETTMEFYPKEIYVNGMLLTPKDLPWTMVEGDNKVTIAKADVESGKNERFYEYYKVELGRSSSMLFKFYKEYLTVTVSGHADDFADAVGLLGEYETGEMVGRAGKIMHTSFKEFGFEWQVSPDDAQLFRKAREPQLPFEQCRLPTAPRPSLRKLRGANASLSQDAEVACAHVSGSDYHLCVEDILATGDLGLAAIW
uniref:VWFD domain-containing protein n=1 Tax=Amphora coffeiformis TaxID=265554 RepID=A0A7S3P468_9STRA|mmetsp:Transcript_8634/g.16614  ORF Transcript_8634/g.16614 Transcript_8634/m.16614 type:complete len:704 (+) Transcript_8634:126-2237(+)